MNYKGCRRNGEQKRVRKGVLSEELRIFSWFEALPLGIWEEEKPVSCPIEAVPCPSF